MHLLHVEFNLLCHRLRNLLFLDIFYYAIARNKQGRAQYKGIYACSTYFTQANHMAFY